MAIWTINVAEDRAATYTPHIARVRHLNDKKKADRWRAG